MHEELCWRFWVFLGSGGGDFGEMELEAAAAQISQADKAHLDIYKLTLIEASFQRPRIDRRGREICFKSGAENGRI